jgi:hypothetical protein
MNNLKERNLVPDSVQESPEDPPGFIYPSYRTAQSVIKRVQRPLKGSHQPSAYVSSAVGGSVSTLSFEDNKNSNRLSPPRHCGGGIRDRIRASLGRAAQTSSDASQTSTGEPSGPSRDASSFAEVVRREAIASVTTRWRIVRLRAADKDLKKRPHCYIRTIMGV